MKIQDGYDGMTTHLKLTAHAEAPSAELWIKQDGLEGVTNETLAQVTLGELLDLRNEINQVIQEITT